MMIPSKFFFKKKEAHCFTAKVSIQLKCQKRFQKKKTAENEITAIMYKIMSFSNSLDKGIFHNHIKVRVWLKDVLQNYQCNWWQAHDYSVFQQDSFPLWLMPSKIWP
jgi:hypothetical protein